VEHAESLARTHKLHPNINLYTHDVSLLADFYKILGFDDTDANFALLTAAGVPAVSPPHDWLYGRLRIARVADPDGIPFRFCRSRR
jgi:catechol 2,3-dioxygenase-like lactoylglutathione lyase family enzyme